MLATSNVIIKGPTLANEATLSHQTLTYSSSRGRIDHSITFNVDLTMATINLARTLTAQLFGSSHGKMRSLIAARVLRQTFSPTVLIFRITGSLTLNVRHLGVDFSGELQAMGTCHDPNLGVLVLSLYHV